MLIPSMSLKGQAAIVTGARRGIGKDTALILAEAGADVAVCDLVIDTGELDCVAAEIKAMGRRVLAWKADASSGAEMGAVVEKTVKEFGKVSILVNNAGIGSPEGPPEPDTWETRQKQMEERMANRGTRPMVSMFNEEGWQKVMATNLQSVIVCSRAVVDEMVKNGGGAIVNVSSVTAYARGGGAFSAYAVSKRGIVMVTEGLAADLAKYNIRVNAIAPGGIETELMRYVWGRPEVLKNLESKMLLGNKLLKPLECARLIYFLVSDLSASITGQTIVVDGGLMMASAYNG